MIVIKENNRVYMFQSTYDYGEPSRWDQALIPDNMPIFKAARANVLIGGDCVSDLEAIRYLRLPFPAELTAPKLTEKVLPIVKSALKALDRLDEDDNVSYMAFAKGDRAFMLTSNFALAEIEKEKAFGWQAERLRYALLATQGEPMIQRVKKIYQTVGKQLSINMFPLIMADSKSFQVKILQEDNV